MTGKINEDDVAQRFRVGPYIPTFVIPQGSACSSCFPSCFSPLSNPYFPSMKSSTMTFWQKAKRFFEPLKENKILLTLSIFKFSLWALYALASVYIIRYAVIYTESQDSGKLLFLLKIFSLFFIVYLAISYVFRKVDWPYLYHNIERYIYKKYIPKIIALDNNYLEVLGT